MVNQLLDMGIETQFFLRTVMVSPIHSNKEVLLAFRVPFNLHSGCNRHFGLQRR